MIHQEKAFAKINLCLDVVSRKSDGYHNVESIMHTIPLWDDVQIQKSDIIEITCSNPLVPTDSSNLAYKAAKLFFEATSIDGGCFIHIEKRIPMAAGMAGGSADAAATLRGLNVLYGAPLSLYELEKLGEKLGADVPFCTRGGTEGVTGIGYDFSEVAPPPSFIYVIACGGEGISTPFMYKEYDKRYSPPISDEPDSDFVGKSKDLKIALKNGDRNDILSKMFNCFEEIAEENRPKISEIKKIMKKHGCIFSMMSGSGPSVFGIFDDVRSAQNAKEEIEKSESVAFVVIDE